MCQFFSIVFDHEGNPYYYNLKQRKEEHCQGKDLDSHSFIFSSLVPLSIESKLQKLANDYINQIDRFYNSFDMCQRFEILLTGNFGKDEIFQDTICSFTYTDSVKAKILNWLNDFIQSKEWKQLKRWHNQRNKKVKLTKSSILKQIPKELRSKINL